MSKNFKDDSVLRIKELSPCLCKGFIIYKPALI